MISKISALSSIVIAYSMLCGECVQASEVDEDLARLQGTWRLIEYENSSGKRTQEKENLWVFSGRKLYKKNWLIETVYEVQIDPGKVPKLLEMTYRERGVPRNLFSPELAIYKFNGENLVIATSRITGKYPENFIPTAPDGMPGSVDFVLTLKRIDAKANIPDEMLKHFEDVPIQRTKNRQAEAALLKLIAGLISREPLEVIQPLVADGKATELLKRFDNIPVVDLGVVEDGLKRVTARDVVLGEQLTGSDGERFVVRDEHFGSSKILLVLQDNGVDGDVFWLHRVDGRWVVDVTGLIVEKHSRDLGLFGGIRVGMSRHRVQECLDHYRVSLRLAHYVVVKSADSELILDWQKNGSVVRHTFTFAKGRLSGYTSETLAE